MDRREQQDCHQRVLPDMCDRNHPAEPCFSNKASDKILDSRLQSRRLIEGTHGDLLGLEDRFVSEVTMRSFLFLLTTLLSMLATIC